MAHDVFISHASRDKVVADAVCAALESAGVRCWLAPRDVQAGRSFAGEVTRAIKNARVMVLIFSANSNNSEQVLREVQLAADGHLHIIQFRIEDIAANDDLKYFLSIPHWLDAITPPLKGHLGRLVSSIKPLLDQTAAQTLNAPVEPDPATPAVSSMGPNAALSVQPTQTTVKSKQWLVGLVLLFIGAALWFVVSRPSHPPNAGETHAVAAASPSGSASVPPSAFASAESVSSAVATSGGSEGNKRESQTYVDSGMTRLKNGDAEAAKADFERALQLDQMNARAYIGLGLLKHQKGNIAGALADFQKATEIAPRNAMAHNNVGKMYLERGELDKALSELDRSIELNGNHELAFANRGHVRLRKNDLSGASKDFNRALQIDPKQVWALEGRGSLQLINGQWSGALNDLQTRCDIEPVNSDWARLLLWIAEIHFPNKALADQHLAEYMRRRQRPTGQDPNGRIVDFLIGNTKPENFLGPKKAGPSRDEAKVCQNWMFAGMKWIAKGDPRTAAGCFQNAVATNQTEMFEYLLAQAELKRLTAR